MQEPPCRKYTLKNDVVQQKRGTQNAPASKAHFAGLGWPDLQNQRNARSLLLAAPLQSKRRLKLHFGKRQRHHRTSTTNKRTAPLSHSRAQCLSRLSLSLLFLSYPCVCPLSLSVSLSLSLSLSLFVSLFLTTYLSVYLQIDLSIYRCTCSSVYLSIHLSRSMHLSVHVSPLVSIRLFLRHLSAGLSSYLTRTFLSKTSSKIILPICLCVFSVTHPSMFACYLNLSCHLFVSLAV